MVEKVEIIDLPKIDLDKTAVDIKKSLVVPDVLNALMGKPPVIKSEGDKVKAADELQQIKGEWKRLDGDRKTFVSPLNAVVKAINERFAKSLDPLALAETVYKGAIGAWDQAEAKRIKELNEKLEREAKEKQAKEAAALEKKADKAAASGNTEKAEELKQKAQEVKETPIVAPVVSQPKTKGISYMTVYFVEVVDPLLVPRKYLSVDQGKLDATADAMAGDIEIAGCVVKSKQVMRSSSK